MCACTPQLQTRLQVLILQHPQEQDLMLGSAALAARCLPNSRRVVGLSWPSLSAVLGGAEVRPAQWGVLYPSRALAAAAAPGAGSGPQVVDADGGVPRRLRGIIVLDGTWSQAKTLWWRNAWLLKCQRLSVVQPEPSIYGKLRRQPQRHCISTLEAIAEALVSLGEPQSVRVQMRRTFRTFVQRLRDLPQPQALACGPERTIVGAQPSTPPPIPQGRVDEKKSGLPARRRL